MLIALSLDGVRLLDGRHGLGGDDVGGLLADRRWGRVPWPEDRGTQHEADGLSIGRQVPREDEPVQLVRFVAGLVADG